MHTIRRTILGAAGAAVLGAGAFTGVAAAEPAPAPPPPGGGMLLLTSGHDVAGLICGPDVGTHPDPAKACDAIRVAGGDFTALPAEKRVMCTMEYRPTPASARGVWVGDDGPRFVDFSTVYGNECSAGVRSGGVFGF